MTDQNELLIAERILGDLPDEADVVVVRAGAAGCVLAGRISAETDRQVLLLEAAAPPAWNRKPGPRVRPCGCGEV